MSAYGRLLLTLGCATSLILLPTPAQAYDAAGVILAEDTITHDSLLPCAGALHEVEGDVRGALRPTDTFELPDSIFGDISWAVEKSTCTFGSVTDFYIDSPNLVCGPGFGSMDIDGPHFVMRVGTVCDFPHGDHKELVLISGQWTPTHVDSDPGNPLPQRTKRAIIQAQIVLTL